MPPGMEGPELEDMNELMKDMMAKVEEESELRKRVEQQLEQANAVNQAQQDSIESNKAKTVAIMAEMMKKVRFKAVSLSSRVVTLALASCRLRLRHRFAVAWMLS